MRAYSVTQACPTSCDAVDFSPAGSSVRGILQARILEWVAIFSSRGSSLPRAQTCVSYSSCISRQILPLSHLGKPQVSHKSCQNSSKIIDCFGIKNRTSKLLLLLNLILYAWCTVRPNKLKYWNLGERKFYAMAKEEQVACAQWDEGYKVLDFLLIGWLWANGVVESQSSTLWFWPIWAWKYHSLFG